MFLRKYLKFLQHLAFPCFFLRRGNAQLRSLRWEENFREQSMNITLGIAVIVIVPSLLPDVEPAIRKELGKGASTTERDMHMCMCINIYK